MRYIIVGAGAIGAAVGGRLTQFGSPHRAVLVARGENQQALAAGGLRIRTPDEDVVIAVDVVGSPAELELQSDDVLVFSTKTQSLSGALQEWVDRPVRSVDGALVGTAGELLPAVMLLNGIEADRIAARFFERVFSVCIWLPSVSLEPGSVILPQAPVSGMFLMNRYASVPVGAEPVERDSLLLHTIAADWKRGSFIVRVMPDMRRWKYNKLLANLGNSVQALIGVDPAATKPLIALVRAEAEEVLRSAGIEWADDSEGAALRTQLSGRRPVPGAPNDLGGSSWQSLARGSGSVETDYLNGEIVLIARLNGLSAPLNAALQRVLRQSAAGGRGAGELGLAARSRGLDEPDVTASDLLGWLDEVSVAGVAPRQ